MYFPEPRNTGNYPPAQVPPLPPSPHFSSCPPAFPHLAWKLGLGGRGVWKSKGLWEGGGEYATIPASRAFSFRLCRRLSIIALLVTTASRYLSHRLTQPLYWFLLGLWSLIIYTCSWEIQAWLRGESPFHEVSPPTAGAFIEMPPWSRLWDGWQTATGQRW